MHNVLIASLVVSLLGMFLGSGMLALADLRGSVLLFVSLIGLGASLALLLRRRNIGIARAFVLIAAACLISALGVAVAPHLRNAFLIANLDRYEGIASRCKVQLGGSGTVCVLTSADKSVARVAILDRKTRGTVTILPAHFYLMLVRAEDEMVERTVLARPCTERLKGRWILEYRC